jgi:membrane dipeptidase
MFHEKGIQYLTLTWMKSHEWADSSTDDPKSNGLSKFGIQVIQEMNRLGMLIDLSHASDKVVDQVFELTTKPVLFTHSNCRALADIPRNVSDEILRKLAKNGGVMGINFYSRYMSTGENLVTLETVLDHIDHAVNVAGIDHVGLGSDFDGADQYPKGLEDCSKYPAITEGLLKRNYSDQDIRKILGENFLRIFKA